MTHRDKVEPDEKGVREADFIMELDVGTLIELDIDAINELACEAWGSVELQDIFYDACGYKDKGIVLVRVIGYEREEA